MKRIFLLCILSVTTTAITGCSASEYHRYHISNSLQVSKQNFHIHALRGTNPDTKPQAFPLGMGGFTTSAVH